VALEWLTRRYAPEPEAGVPERLGERVPKGTSLSAPSNSSVSEAVVILAVEAGVVGGDAAVTSAKNARRHQGCRE
jgi:hypothetical protein